MLIALLVEERLAVAVQALHGVNLVRNARAKPLIRLKLLCEPGNIFSVGDSEGQNREIPARQ